MYKYNAVVERVIDGDTFIAVIDLGFNISIRERIRMLGINAPEVHGDSKEKGLDAKAFLTEILEGEKVILETEKDDDFGRWLARVYMKEDDDKLTDVCQLMLDTGHAVPYKK
jgi:micrococcal nuclease